MRSPLSIRRLLLFTSLLFISNCLFGQQVVPQVDVQGFDGKTYPIYRTSSKANVVIFLSPDCPICRKYSHVLRQLDSLNAQGKISLIGVVPSSAYTKNELVDYASTHQFRFPIILDSDKRIAHLLGATTTPHAFVLTQSGAVAYQGMIDNWFYKLGKYRTVVTEHYLSDAIDALVSGKTPSVQQTNPIGCIIE